MPAEAGIQVPMDGFRDIHVDLDSSSPCWNDELRALLEVTGVFPAVFSKENTKGFVGAGLKPALTFSS